MKIRISRYGTVGYLRRKGLLDRNLSILQDDLDWDVKVCNCAKCGSLLLGPSERDNPRVREISLSLALWGEDDRPYCLTCLDPQDRYDVWHYEFPIRTDRRRAGRTPGSSATLQESYFLGRQRAARDTYIKGFLHDLFEHNDYE